MSQSLKLKKTEFSNYLLSLAKINDTAILNFEDDEVSCITASEDNSLFLWAKISGDFGITQSLSIPSISKLVKAIKLIPSEDIEFSLNSNHLEYVGNKLKFKYFLFDDGILTKSKLSVAKIESFTYDCDFDFTGSILSKLLKQASIFKEATKLYLYSEDDKLVWSFADRTQPNTDALTIIGEDVDFELDEFILKLENLKLLVISNTNTIKFNINSKIGVGNFQIQDGPISLNYIVSSLQK
jgi:hypothetical protein